MVVLKAAWMSHYIGCDWYFIYFMVVGLRKNMILLFENKLSYIFCVVVLVSRTLNELDDLSNSTIAVGCWFVYLCVIFYLVFCEIWINCGYVWPGVVGLEINVWYCFWKCEKLVFVPLLIFSATSQTVSLRHPTHAATSDPLVAQRPWNRSSRA